MYFRILFILFICTLCACSSTPERQKTVLKIPIFLDKSVIGKQLKVPTIEQIFELTMEQQKDFLNKYNSPKYKLLSPGQRIFRYLQRHLKNFNFHSETLRATEVLSQDLGNCLSLAVLTKALANIVGVEVRYELVETPTVFQKEGGILLSSQHIRTALYDVPKSKGRITDNISRSGVTIDYFPIKGARILRWPKENNFYSMFYSNKAAEAMVNNKNSLAFWYLKEALNLQKDNIQAISIMGVLHGKLGYPDYAEKIYLYGLAFEKDQKELLNNYYVLLVREGKKEEAKKIAKRLEKHNNTNPFSWVGLGDRAYKDKNYVLAIKLYRKASLLARYLHEPYAGIARAKYQLGDTKGARKAIKKALINSHKKETTSLYKTKYELFQKNRGKKML